MDDYIFLFKSHSLFRKKTSYWIAGLFHRFKESQEKKQTNKQTKSNDDDNNKIRIFVDQDYPVISQFLISLFFSRSCGAILPLTSRLKIKPLVIYTETARGKSLTAATCVQD